MKQTEQEIINIKQLIAEMWQLVDSQVRRAKNALLEYNKEAAHEIITREKSVNAYELLLDRECENFVALSSPVAVDLRFVLSLMKINNNLERIGDFAEGIALFVAHTQQGMIEKELSDELELSSMFDEVCSMLDLCKRALMNEDTNLATKVFLADEKVDVLNMKSVKALTAYVVKNPLKTEECFGLYGAIRRLERIGDRCNNIAEDIIFYVDAKEIRHERKK